MGQGAVVKNIEEKKKQRRVFVMEGQRTVSGQGHTDVAHEQMVDYKSGGGNPSLG